MASTNTPAEKRGILDRPDTPAHWFSLVVGLFLLALGVLALIITARSFGTVGSVSDNPQFLIWAVSGWTTIFWIVMGAIGLLAVPRFASARTYALVAGVVFAVVAIWGFIDGNNVFGIFAADTTNNITHAIIAGLGLLIGFMPNELQRPHRAGGHGHVSPA